MALKTQRFIYTARNFETGLTDVVANIRRNGASVATGVALSEIGNGLYELVLSAANQTSYGGEGFYDVYINSPSKNAPATASRWLLANDESDLNSRLTTIESKIDVVDGNVDDIKSEVQNGTYGLSALKALIDSVSSVVSNISNVTRFVAAVPVNMSKPDAGNTRYRIPMRIYDNAGNLEDPDSNAVAVSISDEAGNDRTSYLVGYVAGPVNATRTGVGVYYIDLDIPSSADLEQLNFNFAYTENSIPLSAVRTANVVEGVPDGVALESTAQDILTDTADMQPRVLDIQDKVNNATYGLAALKTLLDSIAGYTDGIEGELANATYGLSAIKTAVNSKASQASVDAITTNLDSNVKGTGFSSSTDSLKAISDRVYNGGSAV